MPHAAIPMDNPYCSCKLTRSTASCQAAGPGLVLSTAGTVQQFEIVAMGLGAGGPVHPAVGEGSVILPTLSLSAPSLARALSFC